MALSKEEETKLRAMATENGDDPDEIVTEVTAILDSEGAAPQSGAPAGPGSEAEKPKLFMYHLPFVTVREVRTKWLELTDPFPGDNEVAAAWAAKFAAPAAAPADETAAPA